MTHQKYDVATLDQLRLDAARHGVTVSQYIVGLKSSGQDVSDAEALVAAAGYQDTDENVPGGIGNRTHPDHSGAVGESF